MKYSKCLTQYAIILIQLLKNLFLGAWDVVAYKYAIFRVKSMRSKSIHLIAVSSLLSMTY